MGPPRILRRPVAVHTSAARSTFKIGAGPVLHLDSDWNQTESGILLDTLQRLTDDKLTLSNGDVTADGTGNGRHPVGTTLIRSMQGKRVSLVRQTALMNLTSRDSATGAINVQVDFSPVEFFTVDMMTFFTDYLAAAERVYPVAVTKAPLAVIIGHELIHAFHIATGTTDFSGVTHNFLTEYGDPLTETGTAEEFRTVGLKGERISENGLRREQGVDLRVAYASPMLPIDKQGCRRKGRVPGGGPTTSRKPTPLTCHRGVTHGERRSRSQALASRLGGSGQVASPAQTVTDSGETCGSRAIARSSSALFAPSW
jgi:hypothetical protein